MGGRHSRNKGAEGERVVLDWLRPVVNRVYGPQVELRRNSNHARRKEGRQDCVGLYWLSLEVKFYKAYTPAMIEGWWEQTQMQTEPGQLPVLVYGMNRRPWVVRTTVMLPMQVQATVDIDLPTFLRFFEALCRCMPCELNGKKGGSGRGGGAHG